MTKMDISQKFPIITKLFSDEGLTRKAYLNALTSALQYGARLLVSFITVPIMVAGLGTYNYGLWQILTRVIGYISSTSAKPTQALKWSLAHQQESNDFETKKTLVGSTLVVWVIFLPILGILGGIVSWMLPVWLDVPTDLYWQVRITAWILVMNLVMVNLAALPQSILQGENLGYKRMGLSAFLVILGGGLIWIALSLGMGMIGLAVTFLITTIIGGILYLSVVKKNSPWFGIAKPSSTEIGKFFRLSGWFFAWDLIYNLMITSDVVILGVLVSVGLVTSYTLTKYAPQMLTSLVAILVFGILPGLGGIIGSGDLRRASRIRREIMTFSWLALTFLGATILLWNWMFLQLWVGNNQYAGTLSNLLMLIFVMQFAFIQNDANIMNLSLRIQSKVWIGAVSLFLCLALAGLLVGQFSMGIVGLLLGFITGRSVLSVLYPVLVGRFLEINFLSQVRGIIRPIVLTGILFSFSAILSNELSQTETTTGLLGWIKFGLLACITAAFFLIISFFIGLTFQQRRGILDRIRTVISS